MKHEQWKLWKFRIFLIVLVLIGIIFSYWWHQLESIGHALIIAGILGLTVDGYVKQHLLKEASQDIAKYLIGYQLPSEIQEMIKFLMGTKMVGRNLHLHYKLVLLKDNPGKVLIQVDQSYTVENISNQPLKYQQYLYLEKHTSPRFLELRCDSNDEHARYYLEEEKLSEQIRSVEMSRSMPGYIQVCGREIKLQPRVYNTNLKYQFSARYSYIFPDEYNDYFGLDDPTIGVTITAECPQELKFEGPTAPVHVNRWEYERYFLAENILPYNGVGKLRTLRTHAIELAT